MFPAAVVYTVLGHCHFGAIKNRRLIHVIPDVEGVCGALKLVEGVKSGIVLADFWVKEVEVAAGSRPAPALVNVAILVLNVVAVSEGIFVQEVA